MGNVIDKMMGAFGLIEYEEEEVTEVEKKKPVYQEFSSTKNGRTGYDDEISYISSKSSHKSNKGSSKVVNLHTNTNMKMVLVCPESLEEAQEICQHIQDKKPVIVNLESVEFSIAQRITDFACGACYALNGTVQRVTNHIFVYAPQNVDLDGNTSLKEKLASDEFIFPWISEK